MAILVFTLIVSWVLYKNNSVKYITLYKQVQDIYSSTVRVQVGALAVMGSRPWPGRGSGGGGGGAKDPRAPAASGSEQAEDDSVPEEEELLRVSVCFGKLFSELHMNTLDALTITRNIYSHRVCKIPLLMQMSAWW